MVASGQLQSTIFNHIHHLLFLSLWQSKDGDAPTHLNYCHILPIIMHVFIFLSTLSRYENTELKYCLFHAQHPSVYQSINPI